MTTWNIRRRKWLPHLKVIKKSKKEWVRTLPQSPEKTLLLRKTWLGFRYNKGVWTAGCEICSHCRDKEARAFRTFGVTTLTIANLKRHHLSSFHNNNVQRLMGRSIALKAPPESQFLRVWDELSKGVAPHSVDVDNMKADKVYRMVFCLSEALYSMDREFAKNAVGGSIRRDESDGRLLLYFSLVGKDLQCRSGMLGVRKGFGTSASAITAATWDLVQRFATPCFAVSKFLLPKHEPVCQQAPSLDQSLCEHFANVQRQMVIDAAADEQLSVQQMMEQKKPNSNDRLFPNLNLVTHDHSHATARILKRGFYAIPALKKVLQEDIQGKTSICQMVEHSKVFKDHFRKLNSESEGPSSHNLVSLGAAKHRFSSLQKPLMRSVLRFDTLFLTAGFIFHSRKNTDKGKAAQKYLAAQSTERLILKALMADAAEETMSLLRFGDQNVVDVSMLPREVTAWHNRCSKLFDDAECQHHGFTGFMLDALKRPRVVPVTGQTVGCSGGVPDRVFAACLHHLREWLAVAREVCKAEFPNFRLLAAFQIFDIDISNPLGHTGNTSRPGILEWKKRARANVDTLAKFYSIDASKLHQELEAIRPMAVEEMTTSACTCFEAWRKVLQKRLKYYPTLHTVLIEFLALGASTTVVERAFGKTRKDISSQQRHLSEWKENALQKVLLDRPVDVEPVIARAREVWGQWFGIPRASSAGKKYKRKRLTDNVHDSGEKAAKRIKEESMRSEAAFLRCRRDSIDNLMKQPEKDKKADPKPVQLGSEASKEVAFQEDKRLTKMIEAYHQNILPKRFVTKTFLRKVVAFQKKKKENEIKRRKKNEKVHAFVHGSASHTLSVEEVKKLKVHVDPAVRQDQVVHSWLKKFGIKPAAERVQAGVFLLPDLNSFSKRTKLVAMLKGGYLAVAQSCRDSVLHGLKGPLLSLELIYSNQLSVFCL